MSGTTENRLGTVEMMRIFIDTNVYCEAMRGHERIIRYLQQAESIGINPVIVAELISGFKMKDIIKR
jgi:predicted nucleic acid-binding protein